MTELRDGSWVDQCRRQMSTEGDVAVFDDTFRYRYLLTRGLRFRNLGEGTLGVVMLNPSTADAFKDDPTIRRLRQFAKRWGFEDVLVANLFAWRSPHPRCLKDVADPVGPNNDAALQLTLLQSSSVLVAWGRHPFAAQRAEAFVEMASFLEVSLLCLGTTGDGSPIHPMARGRSRVPDDAQPKPWAP